MEIILCIILIVILLIPFSLFGWIMKGISVIGKYSFGCFFRGLIYAFCAWIILMMFMMLL